MNDKEAMEEVLKLRKLVSDDMYKMTFEEFEAIISKLEQEGLITVTLHEGTKMVGITEKGVKLVEEGIGSEEGARAKAIANSHLN